MIAITNDELSMIINNCSNDLIIDDLQFCNGNDFVLWWVTSACTTTSEHIPVNVKKKGHQVLDQSIMIEYAAARIAQNNPKIKISSQFQQSIELPRCL